MRSGDGRRRLHDDSFHLYLSLLVFLSPFTHLPVQAYPSETLDWEVDLTLVLNLAFSAYNGYNRRLRWASLVFFLALHGHPIEAMDWNSPFYVHYHSIHR
jgi:hypothetical protein